MPESESIPQPSPKSPKTSFHESRWPKAFVQKLGYWIQEKVPFGDFTLPERARSLVPQTQILKYLKPGGIYLDVGAGLGHIMEEFLKAKGKTGIKFLSSDLIRNPARFVKKRVSQNYPAQGWFLKATGEALSVRDNFLDEASLFFVMHHVSEDQQDQIIQEIKRDVKPEGYFFLVEDTPETPEEIDRNIEWDRRLNLESIEPVHYYKSSDQWIERIEKQGFKLVEKVPFESSSNKKNEGIIKHSSLIFQKNPS